MVLKTNESDAYPGARLVAVNPITAGECCKHATTQGLAVAVLAAGGAVTFRAGKLFVDVSQATELDVCQGLEPVVTDVQPDPLVEDGGGTVTGTDFGVVQGTLWVTNNVAWGEESVKVEQVAGPWTDTEIDFTAALDGLPFWPASAWLYVENACGRANLVGFEVKIESGAK